MAEEMGTALEKALHSMAQGFVKTIPTDTLLEMLWQHVWAQEQRIRNLERRAEKEGGCQK